MTAFICKKMPNIQINLLLNLYVSCDAMLGLQRTRGHNMHMFPANVLINVHMFELIVGDKTRLNAVHS